jgi:ABC-type sugar transport system ATPase subunit
MSNVSIDAVGKYYGAIEALKEVSVDIEGGEFVVLVGPSG